jgi:hypothetical protein
MIPMRKMAALALVIVAASLTGAAALDENPWADAALAKLLPPDPGAKACYARTYDAAHLRAHPQQRISEMTFFLRVVGYDAGGGYTVRNPDRVGYQFAMAVKRRGDKQALRAAGDCSGGTGVHCVVDCDGGGVDVEKIQTGDALLVRLLEGGIRMHGDCDGEGIMVKPGADDKAFQVNKAPPQACAALEKRELGN